MLLPIFGFHRLALCQTPPAETHPRRVDAGCPGLGL